MIEVERRIAKSGLSLRAKSGSPGVAVGYASTFNQAYPIGDPEGGWGFFEVIAPGAFRSAIQRPDDVLSLWQHDERQLLGRLSSGTLRLSEDSTGLMTETDLPATSLGRDVAALLERGDIREMSFAFVAKSQRWDIRQDGVETRTILDVELIDVSEVTRGANPNTDVSLRGATLALLESRKKRSTFEAEWRERRIRLLSIEP